VVNGQRGRVGLFKLDDASEAIDAVANEECSTPSREVLKDDELVIVQGGSSRRFSGGMRLNVQQVWDLRGALPLRQVPAVEVNGMVPPVRRSPAGFPVADPPDRARPSAPQGSACVCTCAASASAARSISASRCASTRRMRAAALEASALDGRAASSTSDAMKPRLRLTALQAACA
jgi:hypothetical protein